MPICTHYIVRKKRNCTKRIYPDCPHGLYCVYHYKEHINDYNTAIPPVDNARIEDVIPIPQVGKVHIEEDTIPQETEECCVCYEADNVVTTKCGHKVCEECAMSISDFICPMCRASLETSFSNTVLIARRLLSAKESKIRSLEAYAVPQIGAFQRIDILERLRTIGRNYS